MLKIARRPLETRFEPTIKKPAEKIGKDRKRNWNCTDYSKSRTKRLEQENKSSKMWEGSNRKMRNICCKNCQLDARFEPTMKRQAEEIKKIFLNC